MELPSHLFHFICSFSMENLSFSDMLPKGFVLSFASLCDCMIGTIAAAVRVNCEKQRWHFKRCIQNSPLHGVPFCIYICIYVCMYTYTYIYICVWFVCVVYQCQLCAYVSTSNGIPNWKSGVVRALGTMRNETRLARPPVRPSSLRLSHSPLATRQQDYASCNEEYAATLSRALNCKHVSCLRQRVRPKSLHASYSTRCCCEVPHGPMCGAPPTILPGSSTTF